MIWIIIQLFGLALTPREAQAPLIGLIPGERLIPDSDIWSCLFAFDTGNLAGGLRAAKTKIKATETDESSTVEKASPKTKLVLFLVKMVTWILYNKKHMVWL